MMQFTQICFIFQLDQDHFFTLLFNQVKRLVVDSPRTYHEVRNLMTAIGKHLLYLKQKLSLAQLVGVVCLHLTTEVWVLFGSSFGVHFFFYLQCHLDILGWFIVFFLQLIQNSLTNIFLFSFSLHACMICKSKTLETCLFLMLIQFCNLIIRTPTGSSKLVLMIFLFFHFGIVDFLSSDLG